MTSEHFIFLHLQHFVGLKDSIESLGDVGFDAFSASKSVSVIFLGFGNVIQLNIE